MVNCRLHGHENLSSNPSMHIKTLSTVVRIYNPRTGEVERGESLEFRANQNSLSGKFQATEKHCPRKQGRRY